MDAVISIFIGFFQKIWEFIQWVYGHNPILGSVLLLAILLLLGYYIRKNK